MRQLLYSIVLLVIVSSLSLAQGIAGTNAFPEASYPAPVQGDFSMRDFRFQSGEVLPDFFALKSFWV
jgi:hypothetical protein